MSKGSLHERLRAATRALHEELERAVGIDGRLDSRQSYAAHLLGLWRLHDAIEKALQSLDFSQVGFDYPYPYRSALLKRDLAHLGIAVERARGARVPELAGLPAGLGCLYVVEGSAKGARAILPEIKKKLDLDAERGATFFFGFGRDTGQLWRDCISAINAIETDSPSGDSAVRAATETFRMFHDGLVGAQGS
jgi:heme oxygenase